MPAMAVLVWPGRRPDNVAHGKSRGLDFTLSASPVMGLGLTDPTSLAAGE